MSLLGQQKVWPGPFICAIAIFVLIQFTSLSVETICMHVCLYMQHLDNPQLNAAIEKLEKIDAIVVLRVGRYSNEAHECTCSKYFPKMKLRNEHNNTPNIFFLLLEIQMLTFISLNLTMHTYKQ